MNISVLHIEENINPQQPTKHWWNESSFYSVDIFQNSKSFIDLSIPANNLMQLLYKKDNSNYFSRCSSLNYSSAQLLEQTYEYLNQDFLFHYYKINEVQKSIYELEAKISYEQRSLHKKEEKWKSLSNFVDEYKKEFEISDEEFWYEYGNELNNIAYEIHTIAQAKRLIDSSKNYLERAKRIIFSLSKRYRPNQRRGFRYQIAFSTKNLDDEHNSEVKRMDKKSFPNSEFVSHEKEKNYKSLTVYL
jgi:hypothetical protein